MVVDGARSTSEPDDADADGVSSWVGSVDPALTELASVVDRLRLPVSTDVLADLLGIADRLGALSSALVGDVAAGELFEVDGAVSMAGWLKDRGQMTHGGAVACSKRSRRLRGCPVTSAAWLAGSLSGGQVDAIVANLSDRVAGLWADHESALVPLLAEMSAVDTARMMIEWRAKADAIVDGPEPVEHPNEVHLSRLLDGRTALSGDLDADLSALLRAALAEAMPAHNRDEPISLSQRQAAGLEEICRTYLGEHDPKGRRNRPHLNLTVTLEDFLAGRGGYDTETGDAVSAEMISGLACEAEVHRVVLNTHGAVLSYGRATRVVPPDLRTAIAIRDQGCRWPGCDRPAWATEIHHIVAWQHGGATDDTNLVTLCSKHHHLLHRDDWDFVLDPDTNIVAVSRPGHPPRYGKPRPQPGTLLIGD